MTSHRAGDDSLVYTVPQAARLLQVSENHLYNLIAQDAIPFTRFGKLIRIPRWALLQFLAESSGAPVPVSFGVALVADESVHVQQPDSKEAGHGER
jgi:excisionase family DNA binding protein